MLRQLINLIRNNQIYIKTSLREIVKCLNEIFIKKNIYIIVK